MNRGDVLLVRFPHPSGGRGKKRPVVGVQADTYNQNLRTLVVAEVTTNLSVASDAVCLFIGAATSEGRRPASCKTRLSLVYSWPRSRRTESTA
jgi:mRNA-degrading endonuclease toxin of MazEF toxin-antitoxin module